MSTAKKLGYRLFGIFFTIFRVFPVDSDKTFLYATHDDGPEGNIAVTARAIKKKNPQMKFVCLRKEDRGRSLFSFFFVKAFHMATSGIILLDNVFMPMAYTPISRKTRVIQLWHGTGTIKKFGLDAEGEEVAAIARRGNQRLTYLIVNGERTRRQYGTAFGVPPSKIRMLGLPRTDLLLDAAYIKKKKREFMAYLRDLLPEPETGRYILYAPTFRDQEENPRLMLDPEKVISVLPDDVVLLLRFHPFVAEKFSKQFGRLSTSRILDMSAYPGVTTLLAAADVLVTDYSSIVFEYALLKRPMVFYAYDLEEFEHTGRDFYEPYEGFVPGPVVKDEKSLTDALNDALDKGQDVSVRARIETFLSENYRLTDGKAAERVASLALMD